MRLGILAAVSPLRPNFKWACTTSTISGSHGSPWAHEHIDDRYSVALGMNPGAVRVRELNLQRGPLVRVRTKINQSGGESSMEKYNPVSRDYMRKSKLT